VEKEKLKCKLPVQLIGISASRFKPEHFYQYGIVISVNWLLKLPVFNVY
jgi:hypothetical protein